MLVAALVITITTMLCFILSLIFKPSIKIKKITIQLFWVIPLIGAITLIVFQVVPILLSDPKSLLYEFTNTETNINPLQILVLFISISLLSIVLDEAGFFKLMANIALKKAGKSQIKLFLILYVIIAILTIFTSNDIIILTFTPFICYFTKRANIKALPYLLASFISANTWSLFLIIGNPTNIFLATTYSVDFFKYLTVMVLPTLVISLTAFLVVFLLFYKDLKKPIEVDIDDIKIEYSKPLMIIGLIHLFGCTILLAISSFINLDMWLICLLFAISMSIITSVYSIIKHDSIILRIYKRAPWNLIPFVLSMFTIVYSLQLSGVTSIIGDFFNTLTTGNQMGTVFTYGIFSTISCNLLNNIPMSVAFSVIMSNSNNLNAALYATIIGSNLGAILTPIGALAGIMWLSILRSKDIKLTFVQFMGYGVIILIPSLLLGLLTLALVL